MWTLGEAESGLFDHIPFLYKEVWVNDNKPGEIMNVCGGSLI